MKMKARKKRRGKLIKGRKGTSGRVKKVRGERTYGEPRKRKYKK